MNEPKKKKKQYDRDYTIKKVEYAVDEENYKILIRIEGRPVNTPRPKARANFIKMKSENGELVTRNKPVIYYEEGYEEWKANLTNILKEQGFYDEPLLQEIFSDLNGVHFRVRCFYKPNKNNMEDRYFKPTVPDTDNLAKAYMDAIISDNMPMNARTGYGIKDAVVTGLECSKIFLLEEGIEPFVFIEIEPTVAILGVMGEHWREKE